MAEPNLKPIAGESVGEKLDCEFRRLLGDALKGQDRGRIAAALSPRLSLTALQTIGFLNECTRTANGGRGKRFPACWLPALCDVLGESELRKYALSDDQRLRLEVGAALAGDGWLRERLEKLLADLEAAEQRAEAGHRHVQRTTGNAQRGTSLLPLPA